MIIGKKIKEIRILNGLTQGELADRCNLTKGYISQIENDLTSPTIQTLNDILVALGTTMGDFFSDEENEQIVWKKEDYVVKEEIDKSMMWLVPNSQKNEMEPVIVELSPNSQTNVDYPHEGQEFGYVLEGKIIVVVQNKECPVKKGETFYFTTSKNHYIKNTSNEIAKVLWISSPPNF